MDIFDKISDRLTDLGMTQADLARATGISTGLISQWKKRTQKPSAEKLKKVADALGLSVDELLSAEAPPAAPREQASAIAQTREERKLLLLARRASELPDAEYKKLLKNFEETIDIYLEARGIAPRGKL